MDIFNFIELFGGLAFFLYGMNILSEALKKIAGGKLEQLLKRATDNPFKGLAIGAIITIAIQSSSAMTVMLVGFVNSGIMEFSQTIGVVFGSDIGTTLTAWILSLAGINGKENVFLHLLEPKVFSLVFALIGVLLVMIAKSQKKKDIGTMLLGFAILMSGMTMMATSMSPLGQMPEFTSILMKFKNPILGVLAGTLVTGVIQSSAAVIGIIQSLSLNVDITVAAAIPIIMGANIGTCMTALLSSIGVNRNAKRVTVVHITVKVIGTVLWLIIFYSLNAIFQFEFMHDTINVVGIAAFHSIFNIVNTVMLFPFSKQLDKFARFVIKDAEQDTEMFLDERLMVTPQIAISETGNAVNRMANKTKTGLDRAIAMLEEGYNADEFDFVFKNESRVDDYEDLIGSYLMKLTTTQHISETDKNRSSRMLQVIGEFERLADHALMFAEASQELNDKDIHFSEYAQAELKTILAAVREVYTMTLECYVTGNTDNIRKIGPLRIVISELCDSYKANHVERLSEGICTAAQGFVFNDILYSCGRVAEHSMNVAAIVYRFSSNDMLSGTYMHDFKQIKDSISEKHYQEYSKKYALNK